MILHYVRLSRFPKVFQSMTGLRVAEFDHLADELQPAYTNAEQKRLSRPNRQRAIGGGRRYELSFVNQLLLTLIWLRLYPTHETLGYLFEVSDSTARRALIGLLPLLEKSGRDTMRLPDPGKHKRRSLDALLNDLPDLMVVIDTFEQRVQRPRDRHAADRYYSGKKKQHTLKSQVAINEATGEIVDVSDSVHGPTADISLLEQSGLLTRLPEGVGGMGDLAYMGIAKLHPLGLGATPRRKPRGQPRPVEDVAFNKAFARRRIGVEHTLCRMRRYEALTHTDRHHRRGHAARVVSVAGLVNRQIRHRILN